MSQSQESNKAQIALGLAAIGRPGYINLGHADDLDNRNSPQLLRAHAHDIMDAAYAAGVRHFDAARSYGRAEEFLADWIETRGHQDLFISSKWGYTYTANWQTAAEVHEVKEHSLQNLQKQLLESQALLGKHLNLYQIHSATLESGVLENRAVLNELARIKSSGIAVGLSVSGAAQADVIRKAIQVELNGDRLFDWVQATFNVLEQSAGAALSDANQAGLKIIIKEGLANGRLTNRNQIPADQTVLQKMKTLASKRSVSLDVLALVYVLNQPWAGSVLSGAATVEQLHSNLVAIDFTMHKTGSDLDMMQELSSLAQMSEQYWNLRSQLAWT